MNISRMIGDNGVKIDAGVIINKLKIRKRRLVIFFEDIISEYIKTCEEEGFSDLIEMAAYDWSRIYSEMLMPDIIRKIPRRLCLNSFLPVIWKRAGLLDDFNATIKDGKIILRTRYEVLTRTYGKNRFCVGLYRGILEYLFKATCNLTEVVQNMEKCEYTYSIDYNKKPDIINGKKKEMYIIASLINFGTL